MTKEFSANATPAQRSIELNQLQSRIIGCRKCNRLVKFREKIAKERRKQFINFDYWGKPVPGYGDPNGRLVIVGLAPAAHGGNRTGRVFTGDNSARFLVKHLYEAGFANQPVSVSKDDGLKYIDCYVTAAVRCVPPENKPTTREIDNCSPYLEEELRLLKNSVAMLALGKIAFDSIIDYAQKRYAVRESSFKFKHGGKYILSENLPVLFASYHPSPRNTNTGKLTSKMFAGVLQEIKEYIEEHSLT